MQIRCESVEGDLELNFIVINGFVYAYCGLKQSPKKLTAIFHKF